MQRKSFSGMNCSIARALDEVGEWWSLLIVRECTQGATRFDEFQAHLGIARNILTARLERLVELDILERFPLENQPKVNGYRLTKKGEELYPVLVVLMQWGDRWIAPDGKPPTVLVNNATGSPVEPVLVRDMDGTALSFRNIRLAAGPSATELTHAVIENRNRRVLGES
jgi:DNA-binding HxlR family transcriptional regulator